jgi:hypothetical protein
MIPGALVLAYLFWTGCIVFCVLCYRYPDYFHYFSYGKLSSSNPPNSSPAYRNPLAIRLPTSLSFTLYYIHALALTLLSLSSLLFSSESSHSYLSPLYLIYYHFLLHFTRRLFECFFVHEFSPRSSQSFIVTSCALIFYSCLLFSPLLDSSFVLKFPSSFLFIPTVYTNTLASSCFIISSWIQSQCHKTLADYRRQSSSQSTQISYYLPFNGPFHLFNTYICPHYNCEIFIYLSFVLIYPKLIILFIWIWVICNLYVTATKTKQWYMKKFSQQKIVIEKRVIIGKWFN